VLAALLVLVAPGHSHIWGQSSGLHVGRAARAYVDSARQSWTGNGPRPLSTTVWYPTHDSVRAVPWVLGPPNAPLFRIGSSVPRAPLASSAKARPLVVLSHGTGGSAIMLAWLGETLASAGYIVAGIDHHGNTAAEPTPSAAGFTLWWERATDVSRVIDRLLADSVFGPHIDRNAIGVAGFSLGGYTAVLLAGGRTSLSEHAAFCRSAAHDNTCEPQPEFPNVRAEFEKMRSDPFVVKSLARAEASFRDERIRAAFTIAPVGTFFADASLATIRVPVRIVVGDADKSVPPANNAQRLARRIPGAQLQLLPGVTHYTFLAECGAAGVAQRPDLCTDSPTVDRGAIHRAVASDAVSFFDRVFKR
jgi:predicted dienelactone hydrolase